MNLADHPEMTVVVIAVGAPPELAMAVRSILDQDVPVEVVVVNSGGGDVHARLGADAGGVSIFSCDDLLWPGAARNRGIETSRAPYVAFLAADCLAGPAWVAHRLKRHKGGNSAVASAVVNDAPDSFIARASHVALFVRRLPAVPADKALRYGVSYARELFVKYGLFREDLRIGEDTEFHMRFDKRDVPAWAPEIQTVHRNRTALTSALEDQYVRGKRSARYWPSNHRGRIHTRIRKRFLDILSILNIMEHGASRWRVYVDLPLVALNVTAFELGVRQGWRSRCEIAWHEGSARKAAKRKRWQQSHDLWKISDDMSPGRIAPKLGRGHALLKLKRFDEAEAVFASITKIAPGHVAALEGIASAAFRSGRWQEALAAWTTVRSVIEPHLPALTGCSDALAELGRLDEARAILSAALENFPGEGGCLRRLGRISELQGDWQTAMACYRELREIPESSDAPFLMVNLLISLRRFDEAKEIVEQIRETASEYAYLRCALALLESLHDWDAILKLLRVYEGEALKQVDLLRVYINVLCIMGRFDDALAIIGRSSAGKKLFRERLETVTLVRAARYEEAWERFDRALKDGTVMDLPPALMSAVVLSAFERRGSGFANELLDHIECNAPDTRAGTVMRYAVPFHRVRLSCLVAMYTNRPGMGLIDRPLESRLAALAVTTQGDVAEVCERFAVLRRSHRGFFPDPAFVFSDALAVANELLNAFEDGRPFSLVRLGDGEGNFLPYQNHIRQFQESDQVQTLRTWWGENTLDEWQIETFQRELMLAIDESDLAGIPDLFRLSKFLAEDDLVTNTSGGKSARGLHAALDFVTREDRNHRVLTSCHIHQALAFWGLWDLLLPRFGTVSLITCHDELGHSLRSRYGIETAEVFRIPSERKYASIFGHADGTRHYPDVFESLRSRIAGITPGRVCIVAAGALGKIYCHWIKSAGGIAIDVGSTADYWSGYHTTRGVEEINYYRSPDSLMECYRRLSGTDPVIARLLGPLSTAGVSARTSV